MKSVIISLKAMDIEANAEERPKQEFAVGVGAVLRIGGYRIITSDKYYCHAKIVVSDRTVYASFRSYPERYARTRRFENNRELRPMMKRAIT